MYTSRLQAGDPVQLRERIDLPAGTPQTYYQDASSELQAILRQHEHLTISFVQQRRNQGEFIYFLEYPGKAFSSRLFKRP